MSEVSLTGFRDNLREMVRTGELGRSLLRAATDVGFRIVENTQDNNLRGPRPERLGRVSGDLAQTVRVMTKPRKDGITVTVMAGGGPKGVTYARRHELGEGIRPRPFLRPSRDEILREQAPKIFSDELGRTMQRLFTGG